MQLSYQPITWQKGDLSNFEREIFKQFWDARLFYDKSGMAHFFWRAWSKNGYWRIPSK